MKEYLALGLFVFGIYFCLNYTHNDLMENFMSNNYDNYKTDPLIPEKCYNLLIQKGAHFHLVNTKKAMVPGVNPIIFKDLGEYIEYAKWQQVTNNDCPILYFQQSFDTQGKRAYKLISDPMNPKGGVRSELLHSPNLNDNRYVDASKDNVPYNVDSYAGFDQQDQHIGDRTTVDEMFETGGRWNPMQSDWAGIEEAEAHAEETKKDRTRSINDLEKDIFKVDNNDRLSAQMDLLRGANTKKYTKRQENDNRSKEKKNNETIRKALNENTFNKK